MNYQYLKSVTRAIIFTFTAMIIIAPVNASKKTANAKADEQIEAAADRLSIANSFAETASNAMRLLNTPDDLSNFLGDVSKSEQDAIRQSLAWIATESAVAAIKVISHSIDEFSNRAEKYIGQYQAELEKTAWVPSIKTFAEKKEGKRLEIASSADEILSSMSNIVFRLDGIHEFSELKPFEHLTEEIWRSTEVKDVMGKLRVHSARNARLGNAMLEHIGKFPKTGSESDKANMVRALVLLTRPLGGYLANSPHLPDNEFSNFQKFLTKGMPVDTAATSFAHVEARQPVHDLATLFEGASTAFQSLDAKHSAMIGEHAPNTYFRDKWAGDRIQRRDHAGSHAHRPLTIKRVSGE